MRLIETEATGTATIDGSSGGDGLASIDGTEGILTFEIDGVVYEAVQPRAVRTVFIGYEIVVGGQAIPQEWLRGALTVNRSLDSHMQACQFTLGVRNGETFYDNPVYYFGPPFGRAPIDVFGVYSFGGDPHRFPLLRSGVVNDIVRSGSPEAGFTETYSVVDRAGAFDKRPVTLVFPPGTILDRAGVVKLLGAQLGIGSYALSNCGAVTKSGNLEFVDADFFRAVQTILEPTGRVALFDVYGSLANPLVGYPSQPARYTYDERDFIRNTEVTITIQADLVTDVTLTASEVVLEDAAAAPGRESTPPVMTTVWQEYQPVTAGYRQGAGCELTPFAAIVSPRFMIISESSSSSETLGGVVVVERSSVKSWKQLEAARYLYAMAGERTCLDGAYIATDADPAGGGAEPGYAEFSEAWRTTAETETFTFYDWADYIGTDVALGPWGSHFAGGAVRTGYKLGTVSESMGYYQPRVALKHKIVGQSWEDTDPITGVRTLGGGDAVELNEERYQLVSREVVVIEATPAGSLARTSTYVYGWLAVPGSGEWYYNSGDVSPQAAEAFQLVKVTTVDYLPAGNSHRRVTTEVDRTQGRATPIVKSELVAGAVPAVERLEGVGGVASTVKSTRPIKSQVVAASLEENVFKGVVKTESPNAESIQELESQAETIILHNAAVTVVFVVPVNFDLREADAIIFTCRPQGLESLKLQVHSISHSVGLGVAKTSTVTAKYYPRVQS